MSTTLNEKTLVHFKTHLGIRRAGTCMVKQKYGFVVLWFSHTSARFFYLNFILLPNGRFNQKTNDCFL